MGVFQTRQPKVQDDLHRSNELCPPIYILPSEVLSHIFFYACLNVPKPLPAIQTRDWGHWTRLDPINRQVFHLSFVSSFWRQIALTTPELWNNVSLAPYPESRISYAALLQYYMVHARALEVTITLNFSACPSDPAQKILIPIAKVLLSPTNVHRIATLKLFCAPSTWMQSTLPHLSSIRSLMITGFSEESLTSTNLDLRALTKLRQFSLMRSPWSIDLPPTIQTLLLANTTSSFNAAALYQCPNLVEYCEWRSWDPPIGQTLSPLFLTTLTFPYLRSMTWSINTLMRVRDHSMHNLRLPALKTLYLRDYPHGTPAMVVDFCRQLTSISTLSSLWLINFDPDFEEEHFRTLFAQCASGIQSLGVLDREEAAGGMKNALRALTPKSGGNTQGLLPQLKKIVVYLGRNPSPGHPELVLDMVRRRQLGEDAQFHIEFLGVDYDFWTTSFHEYLNRTAADRRIRFSRGGTEGMGVG